MRRTTTSVLIVEDHDDTRRILSELLTYNGFEVRAARHGAEGLQMLDREIPDIVILDLMMPWVNGVEVLATLRDRADARRLPVLVITATATSQFDLRSYAPIRLMRKPLHYEGLIPKIEELLLEARLNS